MRAKPAIKVYRVVRSHQQVTDMYTTRRMGQDGHCQQFHTTPTLISAPQWPHRSCNAPMRPYTVGKKPSVKADLAIYSQAVDVRGQCMSESLKLGHNLDFSSCDIMVGFHKSSHILLIKPTIPIIPTIPILLITPTIPIIPTIPILLILNTYNTYI